MLCWCDLSGGFTNFRVLYRLHKLHLFWLPNTFFGQHSDLLIAFNRLTFLVSPPIWNSIFISHFIQFYIGGSTKYWNSDSKIFKLYSVLYIYIEESDMIFTIGGITKKMFVELLIFRYSKGSFWWVVHRFFEWNIKL